MVPSAVRHPLRNRLTYIYDQLCNCPQGQEAKAKAEAERIISHAEEQRQFQLSRLTRAGLIGKLQHCRFDNFKPRNNWPGATDAKGRVIKYLQAYLDNRLINEAGNPAPFLLMHGHWGTGKSHLAAATLHEAMDAGKQVFFRVWPEYLQRLQNSWSSRDNADAEHEQDIIKELQTGDIVCIDDLDKRKPSEWVRGVLYPAINYRYNNGLPTIITLNYGPGDNDPTMQGQSILTRYLGVAVLDRLLGDTYDIIDFNGSSYRSGIKF